MQRTKTCTSCFRLTCAETMEPGNFNFQLHQNPVDPHSEWTCQVCGGLRCRGEGHHQIDFNLKVQVARHKLTMVRCATKQVQCNIHEYAIQNPQQQN
eukprot:3549456-Amphidinium_carterae.1